MNIENLPSSKTIACEDHLIIWFWEAYMCKQGQKDSKILIELMRLGDLLVELRQEKSGFLLPSSEPALVCDALDQTLTNGDIFYHKHKYFVEEIKLLVERKAVNPELKRCV